MAPTIDDLVAALGGKRTSKGATIRCPVHEDEHPSLDITSGDKQPIILTCRVCGNSPEAQARILAALAALGLSLNGYVEPRGPLKAVKIVATYDYKDAEGKLVYQVVRYEPKKFKQRRPNGGGGWIWDLKGVAPSLYKLPELLSADRDQWVCVPEGEKDVENLNRLGFVATCNSGGAGKFQPEHAEHLKGRRVALFPDNDGAGRTHAQVIAGILAPVALEVRIVEPSAATPIKGDISNLIEMGWTREMINKLIESAPPFKANPESAQRLADPYIATEQGLCLVKSNSFQPLANFWCRITRHLRRDDGLEAAHEFELECRRADELATVSVPVNKFASMAWVAEKLPPRFILAAGSTVKDHVRAATQKLSDFDIPESTIYTAPGWRKFGEQDGYVHGGGVIGVTGDFRIELPPDLAPFVLPDAPSGEELITAVRASFELRRFGPERLAGPLFCVPWRAVLKPADFVIWIYGETGAFKTERAALIMQHVGAGFTSKRIYASLHADSVAALREKAFLMKEAPCLCDDYRPGLTGIERSTQQQNLDLIMRAAGNFAGRSTMTTDRRLVSGRPPRGLPILTAEDLPYGESTKGRGILLQVHHGDFLKETLTRHQEFAAKGVFAAATSGFLTWLAPKLKSVLEQWDCKFAERRSRATGAHARAPGIVADLYMAGELFIEFAIEIHAITPSEGVLALNTIWKGLVEASAEQAALQISDKPEVRFIELLQSSIASGRSHLAERNGGEPSEPAAWGWRFYPLVKPEDVERGDDVADAHKRMWRAMGDRIGWVDLEKGEVYLDPIASHKAAAAMVGDGDALTASVTMLAKRMDDAGLLIRTEKKAGKRQSLRCRETLQGVQREVLVVSVTTLQPVDAPF